MGAADVGQYADGRIDDGAQGIHLSHFGDAGFEDAHFSLLVHEPHGKRDTDLRIVAPWGACHVLVGRDELVEPFLHHGFPVASGDAHHGDIELLAVQFGEVLQRLQRTYDAQEVGSGEVLTRTGKLRHHKVAHTAVIEVNDVFMSVVTLRTQGEKQGFFRKTQRTAVGENPIDPGLLVTETFGSYLVTY